MPKSGDVCDLQLESDGPIERVVVVIAYETPPKTVIYFGEDGYEHDWYDVSTWDDVATRTGNVFEE